MARAADTGPARKAKNMMYMQDADHAPFKDIEDLEQRVRGLTPPPKKWAMICHDRDVDDKGDEKRKHWHVMMCFENARSLLAVARELGEPSAQFIKAWEGASRNGFAYLVHRTAQARHKFQYDPSEVVASFDYVLELQNMEAGAASGRSTASTDVLLDMLYDGHLSPDDVREQLSGSQIGMYDRRIATVMAARLERESRTWREKMRDTNARSESIWLYGQTETGKSSMAKELCERRSGKRDYFVTGSSRDPFERYAGQHHIIVEEIEPKVIRFSDLKRMTDPLGVQEELQAASRYHDKALMPELIVFTSPYDPYALYQAQVGEDSQKIDEFEQLLRRMSVVLELTQDVIRPMRFDLAKRRFDPEAGQARPNPYSKKARGESAVVDPLTAFDAICGDLELESAEDALGDPVQAALSILGGEVVEEKCPF